MDRMNVYGYDYKDEGFYKLLDGYKDADFYKLLDVYKLMLTRRKNYVVTPVTLLSMGSITCLDVEHYYYEYTLILNVKQTEKLLNEIEESLVTGDFSQYTKDFPKRFREYFFEYNTTDARIKELMFAFEKLVLFIDFNCGPLVSTLNEDNLNRTSGLLNIDYTPMLPHILRGSRTPSYIVYSLITEDKVCLDVLLSKAYGSSLIVKSDDSETNKPFEKAKDNLMHAYKKSLAITLDLITVYLSHSGLGVGFTDVDCINMLVNSIALIDYSILTFPNETYFLESKERFINILKNKFNYAT